MELNGVLMVKGKVILYILKGICLPFIVPYHWKLVYLQIKGVAVVLQTQLQVIRI